VLRNGLASFYNSAENNNLNVDPVIFMNACLETPCIAIHTREKATTGRKMPNEQAVAAAIQKEVQVVEGSNVPIPVRNFENTSFLEHRSSARLTF
jgi:hypothetical protein